MSIIGIEIGNAPVEEVKNGEKDRDLVAVDTVAPQRSLEEPAMTREVKEFAAVAVGSNQMQLGKGEDDHFGICSSLFKFYVFFFSIS